MNIKVFELVLVALVAFGLGFWQLYDINRELRKGKQKDKQAAEPDKDATDDN